MFIYIHAYTYTSLSLPIYIFTDCLKLLGVVENIDMNHICIKKDDRKRPQQQMEDTQNTYSNLKCFIR